MTAMGGFPYISGQAAEEIVDLVSLGQTVFAGVANGALYAFIGLGFGLINRSTGIINFAQGEFAMLGAMLTGVFAGYGIPLGVCVLLAVLACGAVSWIFYTFALRHADKATMSQLIIMTIGLSILVRGAVTSGWGSDPIAVPAFTGSRPFNVFGVSILPQALWLIGALVAVTGLMWLFFQRTVVGLALRAGAANPLGAAFVGIDHKRLGAYSFVFAGLLGGLGGAIWAPIAFAQVDIGVALGLKGFTAAALGGFGTAFGPIAGGILFGLVESMTAGFVSSAYQDAISYGLLLLVLIVRPQGLLGTFKRDGVDTRGEEVLSSGLMVTRITRPDVVKFVLAALLCSSRQVLTDAWLTSAIFAGVMAIVVMGLVLLTGYAGQISLGQGVFMMIGAYSSGYLTIKAGWPVIAALAFGMVLASLFALIVGRVIFRLQGYYLAMASLSLLMIGQTLARECRASRRTQRLPGIPPFSVFGLDILHRRAILLRRGGIFAADAGRRPEHRAVACRARPACRPVRRIGRPSLRRRCHDAQDRQPRFQRGRGELGRQPLRPLHRHRQSGSIRIRRQHFPGHGPHARRLPVALGQLYWLRDRSGLAVDNRRDQRRFHVSVYRGTCNISASACCSSSSFIAQTNSRGRRIVISFKALVPWTAAAASPRQVRFLWPLRFSKLLTLPCSSAGCGPSTMCRFTSARGKSSVSSVLMAPGRQRSSTASPA